MRPLIVALLLLAPPALADPPAVVMPPPVLALSPEPAPVVPLVPAVVDGKLVDACTACAGGIVRAVSPSAWDKHSRWIVPVISVIGGGLASVQAMMAAGVFRPQP